MNNIRQKLSIMVALALMGVSSAFGQGYTTSERVILDRALSTLENYEMLSAITDEGTYYAFLDLFATRDALVYDDIMGSPAYGMRMAVTNYADYLRDNATRMEVFVKNIQRKRMWQENGAWKVQYEFDKNVSYSNKCGVHFSNIDDLNASYHFTAVLVYDQYKDCCKIEAMDGFISSDKVLPEDFYTFVRNSQRDYGVRFDGKVLKFNNSDQAYLPSDITERRFSFADASVVAIPMIDRDCRTVEMRYEEHKFAIRPHMQIGFGGMSIETKSEGLELSSSSPFNMGIDFGLVKPLSDDLQMTIFAGVGITNSGLTLNYNVKDEYVVHVTNDNKENPGVPDGIVGIGGTDKPYYRHYKGLGLEQDASLTELSIPLYVDFNKKFSGGVSIYADLGLVANFAMKKTVECTTISCDKIYGEYKDGNSSWNFDERFNAGKINGFGTLSGNPKLENEKWESVKSMTFDALLGAGLRFDMKKVPLSIEAGLSYRMGLGSIASGGDVTLTDAKVANSIIYHKMAEGERVRNLVDAVGDVKRSVLMINLGVVYKF